MMAFATRYAVSTQVASSCVAPSPPAICGSATFAMEESSTSMNVASVTVMATIHGLMRGRQGRSTVLWASGLCAPESSIVEAAMSSLFDCSDVDGDSESFARIALVSIAFGEGLDGPNICSGNFNEIAVG